MSKKSGADVPPKEEIRMVAELLSSARPMEHDWRTLRATVGCRLARIANHIL